MSLPREFVAPLAQHTRRTHQHGDVGIVAARVGPTVDGRTEVDIGVLGHGERVGVGSQQQRGTVTTGEVGLTFARRLAGGGGVVGSDILLFANQLYRQITNFNDGLLDRGFKWDNPSASGSCGCGTSFSA